MLIQYVIVYNQKNGIQGKLILYKIRKFAVDIIYTLSVIFPHYFRVNE